MQGLIFYLTPGVCPSRVPYGREGLSTLRNINFEMVLTDYHKEGCHRTFSSMDMWNYAVNVYDGGKVVSLVMDAGSHGIHMSDIATTYFYGGMVGIRRVIQVG